MPVVSDLKIKVQSGEGGTHFASWTFNENTKNIVETIILDTKKRGENPLFF